MRGGGAGAATAVGAAALVVAACGGHEGSARPSTTARATEWATPAELGWLRRAGVWQQDIVASARRVEEIAYTNGLTAALLPLAHCGDTLTTDVGRAPTRRLKAAERLFGRACRELRRASDDTLAMVRTRDTSKRTRRGIRRRATRSMRLLAAGLSRLPPAETRRLPAGAASGTQSRVVPRLGRAAARLASRRHVEVRCWTRRDWNRYLREEQELSVGRIDARALGVTSIPGHRINLRGDVCRRLAALTAGRRPRSEAAATLALLVFAHESQHAAGIVAEPAADCRGMQTMAEAGVLLGVPRSYGERLARLYWLAYPQQPKLYYSRECRNGGALDMRRASNRWP